MEAAAGLTPGDGRALVKALRSEGLIEAAGRGAWKITQAGLTLCSATAAQRIARATAEKALQQFLDRVERVNNDPYFLGKVTRVVLFGSMLKPEVERLSDVDLAVELASKEADFDRVRVKNYERVEKLAAGSLPEPPLNGPVSGCTGTPHATARPCRLCKPACIQYILDFNTLESH